MDERERPGAPGSGDEGSETGGSAGAGVTGEAAGPGREPPGPGPEAVGPPPKKGLSTGAKIGIGCGIAALVGILIAVAVAVAGGLFIGQKAQDLAAGAERQAEATETLERLRREHEFTPPEDGVVQADQARAFFEVTDDVWDEIEEWADDVASLADRPEEDRPGLGELTAGLRGIGGVWRSRAVLAETLDERDLSMGEYLWTGIALVRAREALEEGDSEGVPAANLELARRFEDRLAELEAPEEGEAGKEVVLGLAVVWGMGEPGSWSALGLDTLYRGR